MTQIINTNEPEIFCFGCIGRSGHAFHTKRTHIHANDTPWGFSLDSGLLRADPYKNTDTTPSNRVVYDVKKDAKGVEWSVVSFWDRSGDARAASNTAFFCKGNVESAEILRLARLQWPEVFARPHFPLARANGTRIHVFPIGDHATKLHNAQLTCWCHPLPQADAPHIIVHNAADGREGRERAAGDLFPAANNANPDKGWVQVGEEY